MNGGVVEGDRGSDERVKSQLGMIDGTNIMFWTKELR